MLPRFPQAVSTLQSKDSQAEGHRVEFKAKVLAMSFKRFSVRGIQRAT